MDDIDKCLNIESSDLRTPTGKIVFVKSNHTSTTDYTVDAINNYICNLDSCKELKFMDYFYINNENEFNVTDKIFAKAIKQEEGKHNEITSYSLEIYSYELKLSELKIFIDTIKENYLSEQNNKLGSQRYYFDEHHVSLMKNRDDTYRFSMANQELSFSMTKFNTNKSLDNVYGEHLKVVKERMNLFINNPDWYRDKGIPYTLGILLHGPPGTGKTSLIKAIAKDTDRHIFNIKLQSDTTQTQLNNLFFNENVNVLKKGKNELYSIPLNKRIYVIEDIDCNNDILLQRQYQTTKEKIRVTKPANNTPAFQYHDDNIFGGQFASLNNPTNNSSKFTNCNYNSCQSEHIPGRDINKQPIDLGPEEDQSEKVTLSFILNLLDGILETPGRILIMTSNYPDKLDTALIRPGRIDINLKVGYCDNSMIYEMYNNFYKIKDEDKKTFKLDNINEITPAHLNKILLDNFNDKEKAYNDIIDSLSNI